MFTAAFLTCTAPGVSFSLCSTESKCHDLVAQWIPTQNCFKCQQLTMTLFTLNWKTTRQKPASGSVLLQLIPLSSLWLRLLRRHTISYNQLRVIGCCLLKAEGLDLELGRLIFMFKQAFLFVFLHTDREKILIERLAKSYPMEESNYSASVQCTE